MSLRAESQFSFHLSKPLAADVRRRTLNEYGVPALAGFVLEIPTPSIHQILLPRLSKRLLTRLPRRNNLSRRNSRLKRLSVRIAAVDLVKHPKTSIRLNRFRKK